MLRILRTAFLIALPLLGSLPVVMNSTLPAVAQNLTKDTKPYDKNLMRLSEILGAIHYLRELCQAGDKQLWREQMQSLMKAEGSSAIRRARLTRSFNQGYRSYQRTYNVCTPSARTTIERFFKEGVRIGDEIFKKYPK